MLLSRAFGRDLVRYIKFKALVKELLSTKNGLRIVLEKKSVTTYFQNNKLVITDCRTIKINLIHFWMELIVRSIVLRFSLCFLLVYFGFLKLIKLIVKILWFLFINYSLYCSRIKVRTHTTWCWWDILSELAQLLSSLFCYIRNTPTYSATLTRHQGAYLGTVHVPLRTNFL